MKLTAIFAALLLCLALAGCGGGEEASQSPASGGESRSTAPAPEAEDPVGQAEAPVGQAEAPEETPESPSSGNASSGSPSSEAAQEPKETAYGSGTWYLEAPGDDGVTMDRLQFQDGKLVFHSYSYPDYGKGGYGEGGSDPLEFSPYCQMTLEEAAADLEAKGRTVTISQ